MATWITEYVQYIYHIKYVNITLERKMVKINYLIGMKRSNDENMPLFGKRLLALRKSRNLKQADLANALGVSRETISYYESRANNPTIELINKISAYFGVPPEYLIIEYPQKRAKPGPTSKIEKQLESIRKLPKEKQKAISAMLDMALQSESVL